MAIIYEIKRGAQHREENSRAQRRKLYLLGACMQAKKGIKQLIEAGFDCVTKNDCLVYFRKRK